MFGSAHTRAACSVAVRTEMMISFVVLIPTFVAACTVRAPLSPPAAHHGARAAQTHTIISDGLERRYLLYAPSKIEHSRRPRALVLAFHGRLGTGRQMESVTRFDALAERYDFLVAYPDGVGRSWNAGIGTGPAEQHGIDDVAFTSALIDDIARQHPIDRRRVFATGMSNGGVFTHRLACELSGQIAAIASVAASMGVQEASRCRPNHPVAVLMINGRKDDKLPWEGGRTLGGGMVVAVPDAAAGWAAHNGCSGKPTVRTVEPGVTRTTYGSCSCKTRVELYAIEDGGHAWPGGNDRPAKRARGESVPRPDASALIWRFFSAHPRSCPG